MTRTHEKAHELVLLPIPTDRDSLPRLYREVRWLEALGDCDASISELQAPRSEEIDPDIFVEPVELSLLRLGNSRTPFSRTTAATDLFEGISPQRHVCWCREIVRAGVGDHGELVVLPADRAVGDAEKWSRGCREAASSDESDIDCRSIFSPEKVMVRECVKVAERRVGPGESFEKVRDEVVEVVFGLLRRGQCQSNMEELEAEARFKADPIGSVQKDRDELLPSRASRPERDHIAWLEFNVEKRIRDISFFQELGFMLGEERHVRRVLRIRVSNVCEGRRDRVDEGSDERSVSVRSNNDP